MADDAHNTSDVSDPAEAVNTGSGGEVEDAETTAARKELREASISEKMAPLAGPVEPQSGGSSLEAAQEATQESTQAHEAALDADVHAGHQVADMGDAADRKTPELEAVRMEAESLQEEVASPKKKRAHDQFDEPKEAATAAGPEEEEAAAATATDSTNGRVTTSRTERDEPEKKRARDQMSASGSVAGETASSVSTDAPAADKVKKPAATSSTAFAQSGFAKLANSTSSPFGSLSGTSKPNLFGGGAAAAASPFGALGGSAKTPVFSTTTTTTQLPKLDAASASASASPFSTLNGRSAGGFGASTFGGSSASSGSGGKTFGSAFTSSALTGAPRLTSFARPGTVPLKSDKPARPFGAPESEGEEEEEEDTNADEKATEDGSEDRDSGDEEGGGTAEEGKKMKSPDAGNKDATVDKEDAKSTSDDRRKPRLQRVFVDDGETGEVTVLAVRAKMYQLENKETGWKERGAGMLKINVPDSCISWDDSGQPIPGSFDASGLEDEDEEEEEDDEGDEGATESTAAAGSGSGSGGGGARGHKKKSVRLLMRQDHTLRVILNTALTGATEFQERSGLKASSVLFTALFEGQEARPVQMKMTAVNAQAFLNEAELIKRELRNS